MNTCPCNEYMYTYFLIPYFHVKREVTVIYIFFSYFDPKYRLWVLVRGDSKVYPQSMF